MNQWGYDVVVIDDEVTGCAVARELSRCELRICVMEQGKDAYNGTSKANNATVYAGYDAIPGTREAEFNMAGNAMMEQLLKDLDFSFKGNGSLVLCFARGEEPELKGLYERGVANGVPGIRSTTGDETRNMESNLIDEVTAAIYAPSGGIVYPFGLTIALMESTYKNGAESRLLTEVECIEKMKSGGYGLTVRREGTAKAITVHYVVSAAGAYVDTLHSMVSSRPIHITPRRDDYCLLDKEAGGHATSTIFQLPGIYGKDVLATPIMYGNLLIDPAATNIEDRENVAATVEGLTEVISRSAWNMRNIPYRQVITSFIGLGTHEDGDDFVIGEAGGTEGFYGAAGIESPGFSCTLAIEVYLAELITGATAIGEKEQFIACRKGIPHLDSMEREERARSIKERPDYGIIICRYENVSESKIIDAIRRPLGATPLDGIKRRVRQGIGRCQTGSYMPRITRILTKELRIGMEDICKNAPGSQMLTEIDGGEKRRHITTL